MKKCENVKFRTNNHIYISEQFELIQSYIDFVKTNLSNIQVRQIDFADESLEGYNIIDQDIRYC